MQPKTNIEEPQEKVQPSPYELFMRDLKNILKKQREGDQKMRKGADEESE